MREFLSSLIIIFFLLSGCKPDTDFPFEVDIRTGTIIYTGGNEPPGPLSIRLNGNDALKNSFLFHETDSLVCINSFEQIDIVCVFREYPSAGTINISLINAGKENREINEFRIMAFKSDPDLTDYIFSGNHSPWNLSRDIKGDTLILSLRNNGTPVILLPGEKLRLPRVNLLNRLTGSEG